MDEINDRFDWLKNTMVDKLPQLETEFEGELYIKMLEGRWSGELSTLDGTSSADKVQAVEFTAADIELLALHDSEDDEHDGPDEPIDRYTKQRSIIDCTGVG